jgi:hypothetical protein
MTPYAYQAFCNLIYEMYDRGSGPNSAYRLVHKRWRKLEFGRFLRFPHQQIQQSDNADQQARGLVTCLAILNSFPQVETVTRCGYGRSHSTACRYAAMSSRRLISTPIARNLQHLSPRRASTLSDTARYRSAAFHTSNTRRNLPQWPNPPVPQPVVTPYGDPRGQQGGAGGGRGGDGKDQGPHWKSILENLSTNPLFGAMLTTVIGLAAV